MILKKLPEISFEKRADLLLVTAHGKFDAEWFENLISTLATKANESYAKAVLLDMHGVSGAWSVTERYNAARVAENSRLTIPIAIVSSETLLDPQHIGEVMARNRGVNVRVFLDIEEAKIWLDSVTHNK
jgi:hypothetical protein